jgi:hypothetical protein
MYKLQIKCHILLLRLRIFSRDTTACAYDINCTADCDQTHVQHSSKESCYSNDDTVRICKICNELYMTVTHMQTHIIMPFGLTDSSGCRREKQLADF